MSGWNLSEQRVRSRWDRRVIPRWRSSAISASLLESIPTKPSARPIIHDATELLRDITAQVKEWSRKPKLGVAADLLNFSHQENLRPLLVEPSKFIVDHSDEVSVQLLSIAKNILGSEMQSEADSKKVGCQREISRIKKQLLINPRDAVALVDMARLYAAQGQNDHAERAIITAAALQPNHRFILRSASRFFIHNGDPEHAFHLLNRSERTQEDPWLLASLIAVETILKRPPKYLKRAKSLTENGIFSPAHLSELGAALATLHVDAGEIKKGKKFFNIALSNPNDNAVAQAVWAANEFKMPINIRPEWLSDKFSFEANYYTLSQEGNFQEALNAAVGWFEDEPFSSRPLRGAAFSASVLGQYKHAEESLRQALMLDPNDIECKNNLVFALAGQNRLIEASKLLNDVRQVEMQESDAVGGHTLANMGMIYYRAGDPERGRLCYENAFARLDAEKKNESKSIAAAYWVQEAKLANDPHLDIIINKVKDSIEKSASSAAKTIFLKTLGTSKVDGVADDEPLLFRSAITWEHDPVKNILVIDKKNAFGNKVK